MAARRVGLLGVIGIAAALHGCGGGGGETATGTDAKQPAATKPSAPATIDDNAKFVLEQLLALESSADVTCWTSFRQLDWFIAQKSYSEFATVAKIAAMRRLVRGAWAAASARAPRDTITAADFEAAVQLPEVKVPDSRSAELATFANDIGLQNFTHYQKTAEHWRVVLAVLMDEIHRRSESGLKPMEADALSKLADAATTLSLMLLEQSGEQAEQGKSHRVEGEHVQAAARAIATAHALENPPQPEQPLPAEQVAARLQPLTRALIDGKVEALHSFNKSSKTLTEDLNRVSRMPLTAEAVELLVKDVQSFTHFVAAGYEPMQADNYLSDGSFAKSMLPRLAYLDESHVPNVLEQLFPHHMEENGDIVVRFEPNPGPIITTEKREPFEIRLLDHEMNGVRDSAVHWIALQNVWKERPFAMDPFAAEYLSEVDSMLMTLFMRRAEVIAKELGKKEIDADVARRVRDKRYVQVPPRRELTAQWTEERKQRKAEVLAKYPAALFDDVTAKSGLPTKFAGGIKLAGVDGHVGPGANVEGHGVEGHGQAGKQVEGHGVEGHGQGGKKVEGHGVEGHVEGHGVDGHVEGHGVEGHGQEGKQTGKEVDGHFNFQRLMGGGIAVGDVDADGYPDLFLAGESLGRLYLNKGKAAPGRFVDASKTWGIPDGIDDGHGTLFFDMEGDGDLDLLVLRSENATLLLRQDAGAFEDVATTTAFAPHKGAHVASIFDYDRDGDLDIYVGYYGNHQANTGNHDQRALPALDGRNGSPNQLWRREADGKYVEVGEAAGVADPGWALATGTFDHDLDGHLDIFIANDFGPDVLYRNRGDGTFEDLTVATNTGDRGSGMNVEFGDVNRDGRFDIYVTNIDMFSKRIKVVFPRDESTISIDESLTRAFQYLSGNKLYVSVDRPGAEHAYLAEEGVRFEPGDRGWGWDAAFFDYENDGDDDIYITNGWVDGSYAGDQKNQFFVNDEGFFYLAPPESPEAFAGNTRSAANLDFDLDGDVDLVVNNFQQAPVVLENTQETDNHWIALQLRGKGANTQAVGARVTIASPTGNILRQVSCGRGYISQAAPVLHAGLGKAASADVEIHWPDGETQKLPALAAGKVHTIEQD